MGKVGVDLIKPHTLYAANADESLSSSIPMPTKPSKAASVRPYGVGERDCR